MTIRNGFTIWEKHSNSDFDIRISNISTPLPEMKEVRDSVPWQNGDWDFSSMFGSPRYNNRKISITCFVLVPAHENIDDIATEVCTWLYGTGWGRLELDHQEKRYYIAKCTSCVPGDYDFDKRRVDFSIEFDAKPFARLKIDDSEVL